MTRPKVLFDTFAISQTQNTFDMRNLLTLLMFICFTGAYAASDQSEHFRYFFYDNEYDDSEDEFIELKYEGNTIVSGYYWCTSDEFCDAREGFLPGFTVLPMNNIQVQGDSIRFVLNSKGKPYFNTPLPYNIYSPEEAAKNGYNKWQQESKYFQDSIVYRGTLTDKSLTITYKSKFPNINAKTFASKSMSEAELIHFDRLGTVDLMRQDDKDTTIYKAVDELPEFPGDISIWTNAIIKYPEECKKAGIEGYVLVRFVVEKDGSITNIKAIRSPHEAMTQEAERVLRLMPKWKPAMKNENRVRMKLNIPIKFQLKQNKPAETPTAQEARKALTIIYADVIRNSQDPESIGYNEVVARHTTKAFKWKFESIDTWEKQHYPDEMGWFLNYDFWTHSQESWEKAEVQHVTAYSNNSCIAIVKCENMGDGHGDTETMVTLHMELENGQWLVDDFIDMYGSFQDSMDEYIRENNIK